MQSTAPIAITASIAMSAGQYFRLLEGCECQAAVRNPRLGWCEPNFDHVGVSGDDMRYHYRNVQIDLAEPPDVRQACGICCREIVPEY